MSLHHTEAFFSGSTNNDLSLLKRFKPLEAFTNTERLHEAPPNYTTRFAEILFSDEDNKQFLPSP